MMVKRNFPLKIHATFILVMLLAVFIPGYAFSVPSAKAQSDIPSTDTPLVETIPTPSETPTPPDAIPNPGETPLGGDNALPSLTDTPQDLPALALPLQANAGTDTATPTTTGTVTETVTVAVTPTAANSATPETKTLFSAAQLQKMHGEGGPDKMLEKVKGKGRLKVIVGVDVPFAPLGRLSPSAANIQKTNIGRAQTQVLDELAGKDTRSVKQFAIIPYIAMDVDEAGLAALMASGKVTSIAEDIPMRASLEESVPRIGANTVWSRGYTGSGVTVAILDTGVDKTHPFFGGDAVISEACYSTTYSPDNATTICPGGVESSIATNSAMPYGGACPPGECDHGTHVAGIAAGYASPSFAGVAPGASIIAIQVFSRFDSESECGVYESPCALSYVSDQMLGLQRVYDLRSNNIAAVNLSLGGGQFTSQATCDSTYTGYGYKQLVDSLRSVGIATVIASGNNGYTNALSGPGCISSAVSVGSTTDSAPVDQEVSSSNSASFLNLLAPGYPIHSSIPGNTYAYWGGTSMAAPHVAGAWALLKQAIPSASVDQTLNALTSTGVSVTTKSGGTKPRINVNSALTLLGVAADPGTYDDPNPSISYSGSWFSSTYTGMYNNTYHYSTGVGDTASIYFNGQGVTLVYYKQSGYGTATVRIDGVDVGTINMAASGLQQQLQWNSGTLAAGNHTLTLVHTSGGNIDLDAIIVYGTPPTATYTPTATATLPPVGVGTYDDNYSRIAYSGSWSSSTYSGMYNSTYHYSTATGGTASLTFNGEAVTIVYYKQSGYGTATVRIDGVDVGTISMAGTSLQMQQQWTSGSLAAADHTLTLVHTSGTYIDLDAIIVSGPPPTATDTPTASNTPSPTYTLSPTATLAPVGLGTYDDNYARIVYSGSWSSSTLSSMYNGTYHYSTGAGSTAGLTFNGEGVTIVYYKQSGYGTATVRIDGVDVGTISMAGSSLQTQQQWTSGLLTAADHTLTLVHTSGTYVDLDAVIVTGPPPTATDTPTPTATLPPVGLGTYDDGHAKLTYSGSWGSSTLSGMYNSTYHYSTGVGSTASLSFNGDGITLVYYKQSGYGTATVRIDGADVGTISMAGSSLQMQQQWTSSALASGDHTLTLVHTSGAYVDIDAVIVTGTPTATPTATSPPQTVDDTDASITYSGSGWQSFIGLLGGPNGGTGHYSTVVNDSASLSFSGRGIGLLYMGNTNRGVLEIAIDGSTVANLDQSATGLQWQKQWTSNTLTSGSHSVTITHISGQYVDLDAFLVIP